MRKCRIHQKMGSPVTQPAGVHVLHMYALGSLCIFTVMALTAKIHRNVTADVYSASTPAGWVTSVPLCSTGGLCSKCFSAQGTWRCNNKDLKTAEPVHLCR
jgi:hypothetical protein